MPRDSMQRTTRARTQERSRPIRTGVFAPSVVNSRSDAAQTAADLADALNVGGNIYADVMEQRKQKAFLAGTRAAIEGRELTEDEAKEDARRLGHSRVRAERGLVEDRLNLEQMYADFDKDTGTPTELEVTIDEYFRNKYDGLDPENDDVDEALMPGLLNGMSTIRQELMQRYSDDIAEQTAGQTEADVSVIAQDQFETSNQLDYAALNERLHETLGGARGNEVFVAIVRDIAVREGRPDLIDGIPDEWSDGQRSVKHIPKFTDALRNARISAEAQRQHNEKKGEADEAKALEAQREATEAEFMSDIMRGQTRSVEIREAIDAGLLDPARARTLLTFQRAWNSQLDTGAEPNWDAVADLEVAILKGEATEEEIIGAVNRGDLGSGQTLADNVNRVYTHMRSAESGRRNSLEFTSVRDMIATDYTPTRDLFGRPSAPGLKYQARVMREWARLQVEESLTPEAAEQRVREQFPILSETVTTEDAQSRAAQFAIAATQGKATAEEFKASVPKTTTPTEFLENMVELKHISSEDAARLIEEMYE